jgi:undecaprenyl-diphosphatase
MMRNLGERLAGLWRGERWLLVAVVAATGFLLAFGGIAGMVIGGGFSAFDDAIILALRNPADPSLPAGPPWLHEGARDITALGSVAVLSALVFAVVGYLVLTRKWAAAWLLVAAVIGGSALNSLLKIGFARPRPDLVAPAVRVFTHSFPSGHAAISAITYLTLGTLLAQTQASHAIRIYFISLALALTLLVGISRVYLGVHYPTDVLAGWCLGSAWALACWSLMTWLQRRGQVEAPD